MRQASILYRVALVRRGIPMKIASRTIHMGRIVPEVDEEVGQKISNETSRARELPTARNYGTELLPAQLQQIVEDKLQRYGDREFRAETRFLARVLQEIKLPDDEDSLRQKRADIKTELVIRNRVDEEFGFQEFRLSEEDQMIQSELSRLILGKLDTQRRDWHYYEYDERASHLYMATRLASNYACLKTVMKEIRCMDPEYKPKSVLDFGSGVGTTIWAVNNTWPDEVQEFMNIEISKEQQYLCEYLLRGGKDLGQTLPGIFHRQYLPGSNRAKYDMVVAAFSMLELPNRELRASIIENLWHKTNDLLVLVERGNKAGFSIINEARHFILDLTGHDVTKEMNLTSVSTPITKLYPPKSHVLAPCSHEFACPRAMMSSKKNMNVCRFEVSYEPLEIGQRKPGMLKEKFSYVVIRKRPHESYSINDCPIRWPRIVEKKQKRGGHVIQKLCCPNGLLAETVVTAKKYGKSTYEVSKVLDWGDVLPVKVRDTYEVKNSKLIKSK